MAERSPLVVAPSWSRWKRFSGLMWCEWYSHSRLVLIFLAAWLCGIWLLSAIANPLWIILIGLIYSYFSGVLFGGGDVIHGIEEFSMSLPPDRRHRYLARIIVGGGTMLLINTLSLLVLGSRMPGYLAGVTFNSGIGSSAIQSTLLPFYGLLYGVPLLSFSLCFVLSILGRSRVFVMVSWVWGLLATLFLLQFGIYYEEKFLGRFLGHVTIPLLFCISFAVLVLGYRFFLVKEPGESGPPISMPSRWWLWVILLIIGVIAGTLAAGSILEKYREWTTIHAAD